MEKNTTKDDTGGKAARSEKELQDLVDETDTGGRNPTGVTKKIMMGTALVWALFQLWIASPLPFMLHFGVFNDTQARSIHLAFAIFLAFLAFPALKRSPRGYVPVQDWVLAGVAAFCAAYIVIFYEQLSQRPGAPNTMDVVVACVGMLCLLEATRRSLGPALAILAIIFLFYTSAMMPK